MERFYQALRGYWRSPDARGFVDLFVSDQTGGDWRAEDVLTVPVFLAHVIDAEPWVGPALVEALRDGGAVKVEMLAQALNYSHTSQRPQLMERLVGEAAAVAMEAEGADFTTFVPSHPVHVEMLWASFFATGNALYLDRITHLLAGWLPEAPLQALLERAASEPAIQQQALDGLLARAAELTLTAQARTASQPVQDALNRKAVAQDGLAAALAARILAGLG